LIGQGIAIYLIIARLALLDLLLQQLQLALMVAALRQASNNRENNEALTDRDNDLEES